MYPCRTYIASNSPSGDKTLFLNNIENLLNKVGRRQKIFLAGDFNIDILKHSNDKKLLLEFLDRNNLSIGVTEPTRVTKNSATCIDNIFTNIEKNKANISVINLGISDHYGQIIKFDSKHMKKNDRYYEYKRKINKNSLQLLKSCISEINWACFDDVSNNINDMYDLFNNQLQKCL